MKAIVVLPDQRLLKKMAVDSQQADSLRVRIGNLALLKGFQEALTSLQNDDFHISSTETPQGIHMTILLSRSKLESLADPEVSTIDTPPS